MNNQDWHSAEIICALRKKGTTLSAVSRAAGLKSSTLANALARPWTKGENIISQALGISPREIWPSRFTDPNGNPITRNIRPEKKQ